ncbi:MAG: hypothetical protein IKM30_00045, partial [Oscillospiraceae bacterium]|nr:hypothetical protein [Oscillospiraceae bacterium]
PPGPTPEVPTAPAAPAYPQQSMPFGQAPVVPTQEVPTAPAAPAYPQQRMPFGQSPVAPYGYPQQPAPSIPTQPETPKAPSLPTPLFIGYGADGRQIFQTYDINGQPIPVTEPVYSTPPQQESKPLVTPQFGGGSILDVDELMSAMGIEQTKSEPVEEKAIQYTEYHIPQKKKKPTPPPKAARPDPAPAAPMSAAEAKRKKKLDKINSEFEKKLKDRGIDPETGAFVGKGKKK